MLWYSAAAGAFDAGVLGAGSAGEEELLAEGGAGAMGADGCVGGSDLLGVSVEAEGLLVEVDCSEEVGVGGGDEVEDAGEAGADFVVKLDGGGGLEFVREGLEGFALGGAAAVVVDDGVAEDAVEPGYDGLFRGLGAGFEGADVGGLEDVLGEGWAFDAAPQEAEELAAVVEERVEGGLGHEGVGRLPRPFGLTSQVSGWACRCRGCRCRVRSRGRCISWLCLPSNAP